MANFLIYNLIHWYDLPTKTDPLRTGHERHVKMITDDEWFSPLQKLDKQALQLQKYKSRSQVGDIVEIRQDGTTLSRDTSAAIDDYRAYLLVKVPEISFEEAAIYHDAIYGEAIIVGGSRPLFKKFKYKLDLTGIIFDNDHEATITRNIFNSILEEKTINGRS